MIRDQCDDKIGGGRRLIRTADDFSALKAALIALGVDEVTFRYEDNRRLIGVGIQWGGFKHRDAMIVTGFTHKQAVEEFKERMALRHAA